MIQDKSTGRSYTIINYMRFIVSDSMELDHGFGKWRYSHDKGVQTWSDGERLCLYYGYTIDGELEQLVRGEPELIPDGNGKFCVVMLWKDRMQVWVDYFCQSKVYYHTRDGLTVTNQLPLLPLHQEDVDQEVVKRFARGIYSHGEFSFPLASPEYFAFLHDWEVFATDNTVFRETVSVPRGHSLLHDAGNTRTVKVHDLKQDTMDALSNTLDWDTTRLEDRLHQCMEQHSSVIKKNYNNICSTVSEGIDSVLQDMYFEADSRLMYHPETGDDSNPNGRLSWKRKVIAQFKERGANIRLDMMPEGEVGELTERHATDVNLSFLDTVPTLWQISTALPEKPQLILYGQNADEMFMHRIRYIQALLPGEDVSQYQNTYAGGDQPPPVSTDTMGRSWQYNLAHMVELNLYNRDVENQTGVQTTSLYSDRRIFNLVHRMPRPVMLGSMAHAAPQRNILKDRFGFDFCTPKKDQAGYRCKDVLKRLLARTLAWCLRDHRL